MKINIKYITFYALAGAIQFILLGYVLTFLLVSVGEPKYIHITSPMFILSITPISLIVFLKIFNKKYPKLINYFLFVIILYTLATFVLIGDFLPTLKGNVIDKYSLEPIKEAEICYWIQGGVVNPVDSISNTLKKDCIKTNDEGSFKIPTYIGLSPYTIQDEVLLSIDKEGFSGIRYKKYRLGFNKFSRLSFPNNLSFELTPVYVELPNCYNIKNTRYIPECELFNAMSYALKSEDVSYCNLSKDSADCVEYFNYINAEGEYGICTSADPNHRFDILLYWDNKSIADYKILYPVNDRSGTIDDFKCFIKKTSKPVFKISVSTLSRSVNGCDFIKGFYYNSDIYSTCNTKLGEMNKYWGETFTFPINEKILSNSTKFDIKKE